MTITAPAFEPSEAASTELPKAAMLHGWRRTWYRFRQRKSALIALIFVLVMLFCAVFASALAPYDPAEQHIRERFAGISSKYLLGTDDLGRDVLSRMLYGLRTSLLAAFLSVLLGLTIGFIIGTVSGWVGGRVDAFVMRIVDAVLSIPGLLMTMAVVGVLGTGMRSVVIGLGIAFAPTFARLCRAQVLAVKEEQFVEAARVAGAKAGRILRKHIVPNAMSPIIVQALMTMGFALLAEGALSYLGLSVRPPNSSLGTMLQRGFAYKERSQWLIVWPGVAIAALSWAFNVVADGLRDAIGRGEIGSAS